VLEHRHCGVRGVGAGVCVARGVEGSGGRTVRVVIVLSVPIIANACSLQGGGLVVTFCAGW